ncbi:Kyphoscoliosis peptidase [Seminavis robusta]|uniref:Kyphoscoliosis peptidase n=1 Tax=Seminavis robusta TaxID=568900 RepID=A0A9N8DWE2_9STRA|nr:Kyphoscoliosis peptidase [Seminavis robusta]|eukprot:Sro402_g135530.1 Kyphoscoliosis peptidase (762) ;mRNA; r:62574-64859
MKTDWVCDLCHHELVTMSEEPPDVCAACQGKRFTWNCPGCTLRNPSENAFCEMCQTSRRIWNCAQCTYRNSGKDDICVLCQQPKEVDNGGLVSSIEAKVQKKVEDADIDLVESVDELRGADLLEWSCGHCTFTNPGEYVTCEMCFKSKATKESQNDERFCSEVDRKPSAREEPDSIVRKLGKARDAASDVLFAAQREREKKMKHIQDVQGGCLSLQYLDVAKAITSAGRGADDEEVLLECIKQVQAHQRDIAQEKKMDARKAEPSVDLTSHRVNTDQRRQWMKDANVPERFGQALCKQTWTLDDMSTLQLFSKEPALCMTVLEHNARHSRVEGRRIGNFSSSSNLSERENNEVSKSELRSKRLARFQEPRIPPSTSFGHSQTTASRDNDAHFRSEPNIRFASAPFLCMPRTRTDDMDGRAANCQPMLSESWREFTERLMQESGACGGDDTDKIRAVFVWLTVNVKYDHDSIADNGTRRKLQGCERNISEADRNCAMDAIIHNREAVCAGYAWMFARMCDRGGVQAEVRYVSGVTKHAKVLKAKLNAAHMDTHAWNVVLSVSGEPFMVDCTWSALGELESGDGVNEEYWKVNPHHFIHQFYPTEAENQCLNPTWTLEQFCASPNFYPSYFRLGLNVEGRDSLFAGYLLLNQPKDRNLRLSFFAREDECPSSYIQVSSKFATSPLDLKKTPPCQTEMDLTLFRTERVDRANPAGAYKVFAGEIAMPSFSVATYYGLFTVWANDTGSQRRYLSKVMEFMVHHAD